MKQLLLILVVLISYQTSFAQGQVYVNGYYRSNGTYVEGYYRTAPNSTKNDNWSTVGNVNPYTGVEGTKPGDGGNSSSSYYNNSYTPSYNSTDYNNSSNNSYNSYPSSNYSNSYYNTTTTYYDSYCNCYITK